MWKRSNREIFFLGIVFSLFPIAHFKIDVLGIPLYLSEIPLFLVVGILCWKWRSEGFHVDEKVRGNTVIFLGTVLFLLGATLSYGMNEHTITGLGMLKSFFFLPVLLALVLGARVKSTQESVKILWLWLAGLSITAWISLIFGKEASTYDGRLLGIYESPNYLAMLLAPGILLSLYFFFTVQKRILKLGSFFFLMILGVTILLTRSYGALVSMTLAACLFLWLSREALRFPIKKIMLVFFLLIVTALTLLWPTEKFQSFLHKNERSSFASREMIWTSALKIGRENPILGIGPGNFQKEYLNYQKYYPPYLEWAVPQPHNLYLSFWLETGIVGIFGFLLVVVTVLTKNMQYLSLKKLPREEKLLGGLLLSLFVGSLIWGFVDTPYFKNDLAFAFWGIIGLTLAWQKRALKFDAVESAALAVREEEKGLIS